MTDYSYSYSYCCSFSGFVRGIVAQYNKVPDSSKKDNHRGNQIDVATTKNKNNSSNTTTAIKTQQQRWQP